MDDLIRLPTGECIYRDEVDWDDRQAAYEANPKNYKRHQATGEWIPKNWLYVDGRYVRPDDVVTGTNYGLVGDMWGKEPEWDFLSDSEKSNYGLATMLRAQGRANQIVGKIRIAPIRDNGSAKRQVNSFIRAYHRHCDTVSGWKYAISIRDDLSVFGILVVGRPVNRHVQDGETLEITRVALMSGAPKNSATMLIGAAGRSAKAQGYRRLVTYTLEIEEGISLRASGYTPKYLTKSRQHDTPSRKRHRLPVDGPLIVNDKIFWELIL